ncbi:uncharacterized protein RJT21DRAFT_113399 [Scheffersomyces amazonensis]|uniref:uncharacterized protein n=1 Tax=Scheffersomyces amazonensis TaxID=1078765 RepID=UPI00315C6557
MSQQNNIPSRGIFSRVYSSARNYLNGFSTRNANDTNNSLRNDNQVKNKIYKPQTKKASQLSNHIQDLEDNTYTSRGSSHDSLISESSIDNSSQNLQDVTIDNLDTALKIREKLYPKHQRTKPNKSKSSPLKIVSPKKAKDTNQSVESNVKLIPRKDANNNNSVIFSQVPILQEILESDDESEQEPDVESDIKLNTRLTASPILDNLSSERIEIDLISDSDSGSHSDALSQNEDNDTVLDSIEVTSSTTQRENSPSVRRKAPAIILSESSSSLSISSDIGELFKLNELSTPTQKVKVKKSPAVRESGFSVSKEPVASNEEDTFSLQSSQKPIAKSIIPKSSSSSQSPNIVATSKPKPQGVFISTRRRLVQSSPQPLTRTFTQSVARTSPQPVTRTTPLTTDSAIGVTPIDKPSSNESEKSISKVNSVITTKPYSNPSTPKSPIKTASSLEIQDSKNKSPSHKSPIARDASPSDRFILSSQSSRTQLHKPVALKQSNLFIPNKSRYVVESKNKESSDGSKSNSDLQNSSSTRRRVKSAELFVPESSESVPSDSEDYISNESLVSSSDGHNSTSNNIESEQLFVPEEVPKVTNFESLKNSMGFSISSEQASVANQILQMHANGASLDDLERTINQKYGSPTSNLTKTNTPSRNYPNILISIMNSKNSTPTVMKARQHLLNLENNASSYDHFVREPLHAESHAEDKAEINPPSSKTINRDRDLIVPLVDADSDQNVNDDSRSRKRKRSPIRNSTSSNKTVHDKAVAKSLKMPHNKLNKKNVQITKSSIRVMNSDSSDEDNITSTRAH